MIVHVFLPPTGKDMDPTWSEARKRAYRNKETSPNQYYYRFNENPYEAKAGKWSKDEDELLLSLVKKHGPKQWGILSKSIAGRVGYTCNQRYRELSGEKNSKSVHTKEITKNKELVATLVAEKTNAPALSKKRKLEHALQEDLFSAVQTVLDKHLRQPLKTYSIYMYVWTDRQAFYPTVHPIYVGQTSDTLHKRDQQHRSNQWDPPYFDRELKTTFREATIQLIEQRAFDDPAEAKEWMDGQEYFWMKTKRTMRGDHPWGCNTNNARHWEASKAKLHARKSRLVEELKALEMVLVD